MPAPTTTAELLELVFQSGLADEARLRAYVGSFAEANPRDLANALIAAGFLTYFQANQLLLGRWRQFNIGQYRVLEQLGTDTTGTFFLCECTRMQRVVAVKVLPTALGRISSGLERFYREARAMAACNHPNIVCAYDVAYADDLHFVTMEYVDGASLYHIVRRRPLDPIRVAHYITQTADALQHMHEQGLVHRNVKPTKIIVDRSGRIKLGGMNIVLFRHGPLVDAAIRGTPNYIAPEQAINSSGVDHRADIYSLGCTAYHLLTGQPPFTGGTRAQKLLWHQTLEPNPIRSLRPDVPVELALVIERMMSKDPAARHQSAAEVIAALEPWCRTPVDRPSSEELPDHCPRVCDALARFSRTQ